MKLLSVNVSLPREITVKGKTVRTGIFKEPVNRRVQVKTLNIDGDGQADLIGHGGEIRAVLVYSFENHAYWATELHRADFSFGQFGENFTVEGMLDDEIHVGDRFRIGSAVFEVTQPRVPCYKLAIKMESEGFYNQLLRHGRPGFYFRVLEEGEIGAGDAIERISVHPAEMTVRQMSNLLYFEKDDLDSARNALRIQALSPGWRHSFENPLSQGEALSSSPTETENTCCQPQGPRNREHLLVLSRRGRWQTARNLSAGSVPPVEARYPRAVPAGRADLLAL